MVRPEMPDNIANGFRNPCEGCGSRAAECHTDCIKYRAYKLAVERDRRKKASARAKESQIARYEKSKAARMRGGRR